jgi:hypothetical protein
MRIRSSRLGRVRAPWAELRLRHVFAKRSAGPFEPFSQFDQTPFGSASTSAYTIATFYAGGSLSVAGAPVDLTVGAENLLDARYRDFLDTYKGYALSPGRSFLARICVAFQER